MSYHWACNGEDLRRGSFSADYEGRCTARSKKGHKTEQAARTAGESHIRRCRFRGPVTVFKKRS